MDRRSPRASDGGESFPGESLPARSGGTQGWDVLGFSGSRLRRHGRLCADSWRAGAVFDSGTFNRALSHTELSGQDPFSGDEQNGPWNLSRAGALRILFLSRTHDRSNGQGFGSRSGDAPLQKPHPTGGDSLRSGRYAAWLQRHGSRQRQLSERADRKSTRLNSSHQLISYAVFCLKKKKGRPDEALHYENYNSYQLYILQSQSL